MRVLPALAVLLLATPIRAQVLPYGVPSPPGFAGSFDAAGQVPFSGSTTFALRIAGVPNPFGALLVVGVTPVSLPLLGLTLLVDPSTAAFVFLPPPLTTLPLPIPPSAAFVGTTAVAQAGVFTPSLPNGVGLTNGLAVTILPDPTPTRADFGLQDFSFGPSAPGQLAVLDLSTAPPSFRATGGVGFSGNISTNFSPKIAFDEETGFAFALGNGPANLFVRAFDLSADPSGIVAYPVLGDIPVGLPINSIVGWRDGEVGHPLLFVTSGDGASGLLEVFNVSGLPSSVPAAPVQTIPLALAASGPIGLDLNHDGTRLALLVAADNHPPLGIYAVNPASATPLTLLASLLLSGFPGSSYPNDVHFAPDGSLVFVTGGNGVFSVVDTAGPVPVVLIGAGSWPVASTSLAQGSAVAVKGGTLVGVVGDTPTTGGALYSLIDLNKTSATFGSILTTFTTNPGGNISDHRMHARGSIVVAIDGTGATADCQWIDVFDLDQPDPVTGFAASRIQTPTYTSLTPFGLSSIPRDFHLR